HTVYGPGGVSQRLLGHWLGVQQAQISRIESGPPVKHLDTLQHWARTLRIPADLLWFDVPGHIRQPARADRDRPPDPSCAEVGSPDLAALLNDLAADCLPLLGNGRRSVGVSALEDASLAERAQVLLKLFLELD